MARRVDRLELRPRAIRLLAVGDERDAPFALEGQLERLEATLAEKRGPTRDRDIGDRQSSLATEARVPGDAALRPREMRAKPRQLGERDLEIESDSPIGKQVDVTQLRPVLRHGARMIGTTPLIVKAN